MNKFPRTTVGGVSVSRLIVGTNWFLGWSHATAAKDDFIKENVRNRKAIADILEVFFRAGVDTCMGLIEIDEFADAIKEAEDRTGVKGIIVSTPGLPFTPESAVNGFDWGKIEGIIERQARRGAKICMPHQASTDAMLDRVVRKIRHFDPVCKLIRQYGMEPGLSTHMPEAIVYADESGLDVETYISIYNSMGFLMQVEVDWVAQIIRDAKKPVMTIKPMASGQLRPFQALNFVWNTIRPQDMVTVGTMTPKEAAELVELSLGILEGHTAQLRLQETRSKAAVKPK